MRFFSEKAAGDFHGFPLRRHGRHRSYTPSHYSAFELEPLKNAFKVCRPGLSTQQIKQSQWDPRASFHQRLDHPRCDARESRTKRRALVETKVYVFDAGVIDIFWGVI